ncbi:MAG: type IV pili twitching motility protein PilT [Deltaproteobacteria bacterium RBG_16_54_11]|jgi:twitching motility protein PilT|nr:MAG: type IV pili twitching motility protein PilT [Deltaproteobacteria bacterium RBG_16_54_11]
MELSEVLLVALNNRASDIHFKVGQPPILRIDGELVPLKDYAAMDASEIAKTAYQIMNERQRERFLREMEIDMGYGISGMGRFRVNIFQQRGTIAIALRVIPFGIKGFEELNLPVEVLARVSREVRGLVLLTGTTGSGKSTTLAALIDQINSNRRSHIITIEDPIEFLHRDQKGIVSQREIGTDTENFAQALKMALRQDPDVILVGEMRDFETIETAILAAETGHLVLSTLHTLDAAETVNRIVAVYPPYQQKQIRLQLAGILKAVVSQRLLPRADGMGRVPAVEIMLSTSRIRECIVDKDKTQDIHEAIAQGHATYHMQTFDQSLMSLLKRELITYEEALRHSSNPEDFALRVKGILATSDMTWDEFEKTDKGGEEEKGLEVEKF